MMSDQIQNFLLQNPIFHKLGRKLDKIQYTFVPARLRNVQSLKSACNAEFAGKRVGIIGTGATAVQTIQTIAGTVGHLTVFQRTPNWCFPLNNSKITPEEMRDIRARYPEILARCRETPSCYVHAPDPRKTLEVTPEDREAFWEKLYRTPGFGQWQGNFSDMLTDREANALASELPRARSRTGQRSRRRRKADPQEPRLRHAPDPPRTRLLRGLQPAERRAGRRQRDADRAHHPRGIRTSDREHEFDIIIYATGFDAITAPSTGSISAASTACGSRRCGRTARRPISASS